MHKWKLQLKDTYTLCDKTITRTDVISIPPTNGDRTDLIIESNGKRTYKYNMTPQEFNEKLTKEEYLKTTLPSLNKKQKQQALKEINWTPNKYDGFIALVIEIKNGKINIKEK